MASPAPAPAATEGAFNETILQGLAKVMQDQLEFRHDLRVLKDRMITKDEIETIITDRFMTRQEFKDQRDKDMQLWKKSSRTFYGALGGCGCSIIVGMLLTSLVITGALWSVFQFWLH